MSTVDGIVYTTRSATPTRYGYLPSEGNTVRTTYTVTGMTCQHCVASVTEELSELDGVTEVAVDLGTGAVTVTSDAQLDNVAVKAAVMEAGYELAS